MDDEKFISFLNNEEFTKLNFKIKYIEKYNLSSDHDFNKKILFVIDSVLNNDIENFEKYYSFIWEDDIISDRIIKLSYKFNDPEIILTFNKYKNFFSVTSPLPMLRTFLESNNDFTKKKR